MELKEALLLDITQDEFVEQFVKKEYLPLAQKFEIAEKIANISMDEDETSGVMVVNPIFQEIMPIYFAYMEYTNIETGDIIDILDFYDLIKTNAFTPVGKILINIETLVPDIAELYRICNKVLESKYSAFNSVQYVLGKWISKLIQKIPTQAEMNSIMDETKDVINNFDPMKLNGILGIIEKITPPKE